MDYLTTYRSIVLSMTAMERETILGRLPESFRIKAWALIQKDLGGYYMPALQDDPQAQRIKKLEESVERLEQAVTECMEENQAIKDAIYDQLGIAL